LGYATDRRPRARGRLLIKAYCNRGEGGNDASILRTGWLQQKGQNGFIRRLGRKHPEVDCEKEKSVYDTVGKRNPAAYGKQIVIEPFDPKRINPNSYNLSLANELLIYEPLFWI
jgi:hypothetical protein